MGSAHGIGMHLILATTTKSAMVHTKVPIEHC
jgi:hypothetical protein